MKVRHTLSIVFLLGMITSCGPTAVNLTSGIDTPRQHVENGMRLLEAGKPADALREFNRAKELAPNYPTVYVGLGLTAGIQGEMEKGLGIIREAIYMLRSQTASNGAGTSGGFEP